MASPGEQALNVPVADWWFEDQRGILPFVDHTIVEDGILSLDRCVSIFTACGLLSPEKIVFSETWLGQPSPDTPMRGIAKSHKNLSFDSRNNTSLKDVILSEIMAEQLTEDFYYPFTISIHGSGVVIREDGFEETVSGLVEVELLFVGVNVIDVHAYTDIWLPFSLKGKPQPGLCSKNSPILEKALKELAGALEYQYIDDDSSDYCQVKGFRLDNFRDDDDLVVPLDIDLC